MSNEEIEVIELKAQYRILSEMEDLWGVKPSNHRAYVFLNQRMRSILTRLNLIEKK